MQHDEPVLCPTLFETEVELRDVAASHGRALEGVTIREVAPSQDSLLPDDEDTVSMFHPSRVELDETILADARRIKPVRAVFDSLSDLRLLADPPLRYQRHILALKQFFSGRRFPVIYSAT